MKKLALVLVSATLAATAFAAPTHQGVYEARVEALADFQDIEGNIGLPIRGTFGYYLGENVQMGALVLFAKKELESFWGKDDVWGLGVYAEFNIDWDAPVLPYIGISADFLDGDQTDDTALVLTVSPGVKVFLTDTLCLSVQANWNVSNEEIYDFERDLSIQNDVEGEGQTSAFTAAIGLRFLFY